MSERIKTQTTSQILHSSGGRSEQKPKDIKQKPQPLKRGITKQTKQPTTFQGLISLLNEAGYFCSYDSVNLDQKQLTFPDYLLIISEQMKETYLQNARMIGFDFTFSIIKQTPLVVSARNKEYLIGMIMGVTALRRIAMYALVVANQQNTYYVEKAFTQFLKFMGKQPESIITDQGMGMLSGMRNIKQKGIYHGETLWDVFHVLQNYTFYNRELKNRMRKMIKQKCKYQFQKMYLEAVSLARTEQQLDCIHKFMYESPKYCISQLKRNVFVGFGASNSPNEVANRLIKQQIPTQLTYLKAVFRVLIVMDQKNSECLKFILEHCEIEKIFDDFEYRLVRHSIDSRVFGFFYKQLSRCVNVDLLYFDSKQDLFFLQDQSSVHIVQKKFVRNDKATYSCTCNFQEKTEMPCEHIIKCTSVNKTSPLDLIGDYWVIKKLDRAQMLKEYEEQLERIAAEEKQEREKQMNEIQDAKQKIRKSRQGLKPPKKPLGRPKKKQVKSSRS